MKNNQIICLFTSFIIYFSPTSLLAEKPLSLEEKKIQFLLNEVKNSEAIFIRNGKEHSAKDASEHLQHKLDRAQSAFWFFGPKTSFSASDFIQKVAAKSSLSGKDYKMRLSNGKTVTTKNWLLQKIKSYPTLKK